MAASHSANGRKLFIAQGLGFAKMRACPANQTLVIREPRAKKRAIEREIVFSKVYCKQTKKEVYLNSIRASFSGEKVAVRNV